MVDGHGLHMYSGLVDASFQQLYNYRDLAAATGGDHRIARGRLARSCNPCLATAQDIERLLSEKGTRTIVDLRDAEEADTVDDVGGLLYSFATADEYGEVEGAEFVLAEGRTRHVLGGGLEKFSDIGEMPALRENMKRNWAERGSVYAAQQMDWAVVYRNFLSGTPDLWRRALQLCAAPENHPVLFHCSAGRDRTGILAMLVLHICGATQEEILRDYEASKCLARAEGVYAVPFDFTARQMEYFEARGFPADPSASQAMLEGIDRADMAATMVQLEDKYGSIDGYLDWIGFGSQQRARLREVCAASHAVARGTPQGTRDTQESDSSSPSPSRAGADERVVISRGGESVYADELPAFAREWGELSRKEQRACRTLGWSESSWQQSDSAPLSVGWESLTSRQQTAALLLGYEAADFERQDGDRGGTDSNPKPRL